jgi:hypothetical protein
MRIFSDIGTFLALNAELKIILTTPQEKRLSGGGQPVLCISAYNQRLSREGTVAHDQTRDIMAIIMGITIITIQIYFSSIPNSVLRYV